MELNYLALPGALLALIGVIAIFMKIGRKDQQFMDQKKAIEEHSKLLKDCANKKMVTAEDCEKTQGACVEQQREANRRIIADIADIKNELQMNRKDLFKEVKEDREAVHRELMKINNTIGEISGLIGRLRFDGDGRVVR
jgi:F0F1-type ATP synthase membrane subunit b/b'